jgi:hypothetical protein
LETIYYGGCTLFVVCGYDEAIRTQIDTYRTCCPQRKKYIIWAYLFEWIESY